MKFTQIAALCALASTAAFTQAAVWQILVCQLYMVKTIKHHLQLVMKN